MRITNQMILTRSIESIQQNRSATAKLERQIVSGERYQSLSEAPVVARSVLDIDGSLRAGEQYVRNIQAARARLSVSDATLQSVTNLLSRAREVAIQQGGDNANAQTRLAAQLEVRELRAAMVTNANQKLNGSYVFGGAQVSLPPLDASGALDPTAPARGAAQYEIGPGALAFAAHDAGEMFIDSDVIGALDALDTALGANDRAAIRTASTRLQTAIAGVQDLVAQVGARQIRLDVAEGAQSTTDLGQRTRRSMLIDTPIEEAITQLASLQSSYQASLLATSRLLETSLVNFLR